ncbi:PA4575 family protein [Aurantivibrio infirmus]
MRLNYNAQSNDGSKPSVLLLNENDRVEIYLRAEPDGQTTLLACSGDKVALPKKSYQQGPYESMEQAVAARRAIVHDLLRRGYTYSEDAVAIWAIAAQRALKQIRKTKRSSKANYKFDPKDVFPEKY